MIIIDILNSLNNLIIKITDINQIVLFNLADKK